MLDADRPGDVVEVVESIGRLKIDPTAVIAPCEHTMLWSRIGWQYEPAHLKKAVESDRLVFEFNGTFVAGTLMPYLRTVLREKGLLYPGYRAWFDANQKFSKDVLARLRSDGPLPASQIDDTHQVAANSDSGWSGPNQVPRMLEALELQGLVAVSARQGRTRVWDLAERVHPPDMPEYTREEAELALESSRLRALGIARYNTASSRIKNVGEPVTVEGSTWKWRVDPEALAALDLDPGGRAAILNPYDGMLFDRARILELFDFDYKLEQFTPKAKRVYGYFTHPILVGDRFVGLLDAALDKKKENLVVTAVHEAAPFDDDDTEMVRAEIHELAEWLGVGLLGLD